MQAYKIYKQKAFYYSFTSEAGTKYLCYFITYDYLFLDYPLIAPYIYSFNLDVESGSSKEQPLDERIGVTVSKIIKQYLNNNESAVLYICDSSDYKEHIRKRKFDKWFKKSDDGTIIKIDRKIAISNNILLNSLLIHKDNPLKNSIIEAFIEINDTSNFK
ncbi:MAG: hypothetical protein KA319_07260 [Ferruginibacter sp.]|nr:hypothetical protein [Ferruginibacter sp.]